MTSTKALFDKLMCEILESEDSLIDKFTIVNCMLLDLIDTIIKVLDEVEEAGAKHAKTAWFKTINDHINQHGLEIYNKRKLQ